MKDLRAVDLDRRIRIERPVAAERFRGAGSGSWDLVDEVFAKIKDSTPARTEQPGQGITNAARSARVTIRHRSDITPNMRFAEGDRLMQIIGEPAELGRRKWLVFLVEDYRPAGNPA